MTDILASVEGTVGLITLNRPAAINALTLPMVRLIETALTDWEHSDGVRAIVLDGAGERGFCAGGDIRALWDSVREGGDLPHRFWTEEYRLNARIARFPKPIVTLMDGITMGGGVGLGAHAAHRVVTERSIVAMPETGIGFTPDVGGSFLLARAPGETGLHLALTAGRMTAGDALYCGFADLLIPRDRLGQVVSVLQGVGSQTEARASLNDLAAAAPDSPLADQSDWIDAAYARERAEDIVAALGESEAARAILRNSPTSVKVALRAVRRARGMARLEDALRQEFRVAMACTRHPDFVEGIRAQVVDKDRTPRWQPPRLEDVTEAAVDAFFAPHLHGELAL